MTKGQVIENSKIARLESYLLRMEKNRKRDERNNKTAYQQAREMSAWLSVWRYGNTEQQKKAAKLIDSLF